MQQGKEKIYKDQPRDVKDGVSWLLEKWILEGEDKINEINYEQDLKRW